VEREAVLVGIDVGTSKVCALIGEVGRDGKLTIMGHGTVPASGLKKGVVINIDQTVRSIADAVERAERLSGWKIDRAFVGVGGQHVDSLNSRGQVAVTAHHREVTREDVNTEGLANVRVHRLDPNSPELLALYAGADIFVFPTLGDSLPLVIMEAMAAGLPVVATAVGAIVEEVEHGITGFLVPVGDHSALAETVRQLVADPDLRRGMGDAAKRTAGRLFNGAKNYRAMLTVCKDCVDAG